MQLFPTTATESGGGQWPGDRLVFCCVALSIPKSDRLAICDIHGNCHQFGWNDHARETLLTGFSAD